MRTEESFAGGSSNETDGVKDHQIIIKSEDLSTPSTLAGLQTDEQRKVLDTVADIRKCGLESILSLPQLVVCGDQSAGKSSVLEALTEIPFPRNDNLCTRFATEIILRRGASNTLTIKIIPDEKRSLAEKERIKAFEESITDFSELPLLMDKAKTLMDVDSSSDPMSQPRAFARDVLSLEIEGPSRPQLTLVDLPGLIQSETKGVTKADIKLVTDLTDSYIKQSRTICLAVVTATNDYANQGILDRVRTFDPKGERTLGIVTKPDRLPSGSGSEEAFINLTLNKDIFFKLGWHVVKNRSFEEGSNTLAQRNATEAEYFEQSNFSKLPKDSVGIDALRTRLAQLLFDHIKHELPTLQSDLGKTLADSKSELEKMGERRSTLQECKAYLMGLSLDYYEICKAAVAGYYEDNYFNIDADRNGVADDRNGRSSAGDEDTDPNDDFSPLSPITIRRLRAIVQYLNTKFSEELRTKGHKFIFLQPDASDALNEPLLNPDGSLSPESPPVKKTNDGAIAWVKEMLLKTRGRELAGNFNPALIGELFWDQSTKWRPLATIHVEQVFKICRQFLEGVLKQKCPKDVRARLWPTLFQDALDTRRNGSMQELGQIMKDIESYPINYNHYYTDTIAKRRLARNKTTLAQCIKDATSYEVTNDGTSVDVDKVVESYSHRIDPDMEKYSCEEALDCLLAIYKVSSLLLHVPAPSLPYPSF